jgi:DNA modification methylase
MSNIGYTMSEPVTKYYTNKVLFPSEREKLYDKFKDIIEIDLKLKRTLVSFQANKKEPFYRWFKYKEGFSKNLINYYLDKYADKNGLILDPFAGAGATLFAARERGWATTGIELLPVGIYSINARIAAEKTNLTEFKKEIEKFWINFQNLKKSDNVINHISITRGAFPKKNEEQINKYLTACKKITDSNIKKLFEFAAFCVLEESSFTRKDGQYLRWDYRAERSNGNSSFDKGEIKDFIDAVDGKLSEIKNDLEGIGELELFSTKPKIDTLLEPNLLESSSLEVLPKLEENNFNFVFTSPPYCNRYDYTRTYALELVFLNNNDDDVKKMRQSMLSCTVENKEKEEYLIGLYKKLNKGHDFKKVDKVYNSTKAMTEINEVLISLNKKGSLNNSNIPRMVKNYFYEMCFIIFELHRVLKERGIVVMVNDNVRYGGEEIPVDLILSAFAEKFGFNIKKIWTLPIGKGNSSQQMGEHGRSELRKCVYVWEKLYAL